MREVPRDILKEWCLSLPDMTWKPGADFDDKLTELARCGQVVILAKGSQSWSVLLTPPADLQYSVSGGGRSAWAATRDLVNNARRKWGGE